MRALFLSFVASGLLAASASAAAPKATWTCQYAKGRLLMTASMQPEPPAPGAKPADALSLKGNVELVLSQQFLTGKADKNAAGEYGFTAYVKDNGANIVFSPERQIATSEWLIDRKMPSGSFSGMFMNNAVIDGIGRPIRASFGDLTGATPPAFLNFRFMLPSQFFETKRYWARIPLGDFKALHLKSVAKAETATATELKKC